MKNIKTKFISFVRSPLFIGLLITGFFTWFTVAYYNQRYVIYQYSKSSVINRIMDTIDQKMTDLRFQLRGERIPQEKVGVIAIDDDSIIQVGRWPWGRDKMAHLVDTIMSYGPKSMGFDIVFSEPQIDSTFQVLSDLEQKFPLSPELKSAFTNAKESSQPDDTFAKVIKKHRDKLVMGAFFEESQSVYYPYQAFCYDAAFAKTASFSVIDNEELPPFLNNAHLKSDPFGEVPFGKYFEPILEKITQNSTARLLKDVFNKSKIEDLNSLEKTRLDVEIEENMKRYCSQWLTKNDPELNYWEKIWNELFKVAPALSGNFQEKKNFLDQLIFVNPIVQLGRMTVNTQTLRPSIAHTASFNANPDPDGTIRKSIMIFRQGTKLFPSLALQTYLVANNLQSHIEVDVDKDHPTQYRVTHFKIIDPETNEIKSELPTDNRGWLKINYAGAEKSYPHIPASEFFNDRPTMKIHQRMIDSKTKNSFIEEKIVNKAEFLKDRVLIMGATAIGVYDLRVTPFQENFPGVETHVNVIGNLISNNFLKTHPNEYRYVLASVIAFGLIISLSLTHLGALPGLILTLLMMGGMFILDKVLFNKFNIVATTAIPMVLVFTIYVVITFYKYFTEERKKAQLRSTFSKYVSPAIVDEILSNPENINLGGRKQRMSVMFSDVRGFTTISEKLEPTKLSDVLNMYLTPMTNIVFENKGTLDKYMGDAIMAFFGAPIFFEDHAKYACRCALASINKLYELQKQFEAQGLPKIDIGIGINSSDMSVGNMGSEIVRSYTVMGDAVNLGSRLEGINKEYGTRIIISEFTYADVKDSFTTREVDWVRVKGKYQPIKIYELICEGAPKATTKQMLTHYNEGYRLYRDRKFQEALENFKKALTVIPNDPVSTLYIERCQDYIAEPPAADWDGVYIMKTK